MDTIYRAIYFKIPINARKKYEKENHACVSILIFFCYFLSVKILFTDV